MKNKHLSAFIGALMVGLLLVGCNTDKKTKKDVQFRLFPIESLEGDKKQTLTTYYNGYREAKGRDGKGDTYSAILSAKEQNPVSFNGQEDATPFDSHFRLLNEETGTITEKTALSYYQIERHQRYLLGLNTDFEPYYPVSIEPVPTIAYIGNGGDIGVYVGDGTGDILRSWWALNDAKNNRGYFTIHTELTDKEDNIIMEQRIKRLIKPTGEVIGEEVTILIPKDSKHKIRLFTDYYE